MAGRLVGGVEIATGISLRGVQAKLTAGLRRLRGSIEVPINPNFKKANAELAAWRRLQERRALQMRVKVDDRDLIRFERRFTRIEQVFKQSDLRRGIRVQIAVAGASVLPVLAQGALSAAAALTDLGRAAAALPGLFAGALGVVGTMATGLKGLRDAFDAAGDATRDAAEKAKDYQKASRDLARAQRDVVQALKDANREIEDQRDKLTRGSLSVERARLNVQRAQERIARGGFESITEAQAAVLDLKEAHLDLHDAIKQQGRDIQDYYDKYNRAATQTDSFRDSLDRLADATERANELQREASGITDKFVEAMKNLSPAAQDFVNQLLTLRGAWRELANDVQDVLLRGMGSAITDLANKRLPLLREGMKRIAGGLNTDFKALLDALGSDRNAAALDSIFRSIGTALNAAAPGIQAFTNAFLTMSEVSARFLPRMAGAFNDVMARFEAFINRAAEDGSLENWIDRGLNLLTSLGRSLGSIGSILGALTRAYEKATGNIGGFASTMENGLAKLAAFLNSPEGQNRLVEYLQRARNFIDAIKRAMPGIINIFKTFGDAARIFAEHFFPILSRVGEFMERHPTLVKNAIAAYLGFRTVKPLLNGLGKFWDFISLKADKYRAKVLEVRSAQQTLATHGPLLTRAQRVAEQTGAAYSQAFMGMRAARQKVIDAEIAHIDALQRWGREAEITKRAAANLTVQQATLGAQQHRMQRAYMNHQGALAAVRHHTALVADATDRLRNRSFPGLIKRIGTAGTRAAGTLIGGLMGLVGGLGGALVSGTAIFAMYKWMEANDKAAQRVEEHRSAVARLQNQLDQTTGAVSEAAKRESLLEAREFTVIGPDNKQITTNAVEDAEKLGFDARQFSQTFDPTQIESINRFQQAADQSILNAVRSGKDEQWNKFGPALKEHGINEETYAKAIRGEPESLAKFEDAVRRMEDKIAPGILRAPTGAIPDLGTAAENLINAGVAGVASGQFQTRTVEGNRAGGEIIKGANQPVNLKPGPNPFAGSSEIFTQDGSSVSVVMDNITPERARQIQEQTGATPVRLNVDPNTGIGRYQFDVGSELHKWFQGFRHGGMAHGRIGKDRIPAMLSDGEFVMRPEAVDHWGVDTMFWMNSAPKFSTGGWFKQFEGADGPGIGPKGNDWPAKGGKFIPKGPAPNIGARAGQPGVKPTFNTTRLPGSVLGPTSSFPSPQFDTTRFPGSVRGSGPSTLPEAIGRPVPPPRAGFFNELFFFPSKIIRGLRGEGLKRKIGQGGLQIESDLPPSLAILGQIPRGAQALRRGYPRLDIPPKTPPTPKPSGPSIVGPSGVPGQAPAPTPHFPNGRGQPGPDGPASTPGVPGTPTAPTHGPGAGAGPSTPPVAPGGIPTYEQLDVTPGGPTTGAFLPGDVVYVPNFSGSGITGAPGESIPDAPVDRRANVIDYLGQVADAFGAGRGSTLRPNETTSQHSVGAAMDIGDMGDVSKRANLLALARWWISDPQRVASTRELIFSHPEWDPGFNINNGKFVKDYGGGVYDGGTLGQHQDHVHLALEGVPLSAFADGAGAPIGTGTPGAPGAPPGSIAEGIPGINAPIPGPFGPVPFAPVDFFKQIGQAILQAIFGFFGIDISGILGLINQGISGFQVPVNPTGQGVPLPPDPGPDQNYINQLVDLAREYKAAGNREMAESLLQAARDYANSRNPSSPAAPPAGPGGEIIKNLPRSGLLPGQTSSTPSPQEVKDANRALARQMFGNYFPESEWDAFDKLVMKESGYDNWAKNPSSSAFGIGQFLDTTWASYGWGGEKGAATSDPAVQLDLMFRYIKDRYGTPSAALAFHNGNNWYARGGLIRRLRGGGPAKQGPAVDIFGHEGDEDWVDSILDQNYGDLAYDTPMLNAQGGLIPKLSGGGHYDDDTWRWAQERMWVYSPWPYLLQNYGGPGGISIGNAAGGLIRRLDRGGAVRGPGGPTDDKIPAWLSDGEFVMRAAAVKHWGVERLAAMNRLADGGFPIPFDPNLPLFGDAAQGPPPQQSNGPLPLIGPAAAGPQPAQQPPPGSPLIGPAAAGIGREALSGLGSAAGAILAPKSAGPGSGFGPSRPASGSEEDPRSVLGEAPATQDHLHPSLRKGIEGAFNTIGAIAGSAAGAATSAGIAAGSFGAAGPAAGPAGAAVSQITSAGFQMAGEVASGVANVLSSLLVGTVTPGTAGSGSGVPLLPQREAPQSSQFTNVHNGNIIAYNPEEAFRLKERKQAQDSAAFFNRIPNVR